MPNPTLGGWPPWHTTDLTETLMSTSILKVEPLETAPPVTTDASEPSEKPGWETPKMETSPSK